MIGCHRQILKAMLMDGDSKPDNQNSHIINFVGPMTLYHNCVCALGDPYRLHLEWRTTLGTNVEAEEVMKVLS